MRVELVCLRQGGIKLTKQELAAAPRIKGYLTFKWGTGRVCAYFPSPPGIGDLTPPLEDCRLHRLSQGDIVLHGIERPIVERFFVGPPQRQAWWCKVLPFDAVEIATRGTPLT